jgi:hypothetical protein
VIQKDRDAHQKASDVKKQAAEAKAAEVQAVVDEKKEFFSNLEKSSDLNDNLQELTDFLQKHTGATGVYIGYLQYPEVEIAEDAGDDEHLNTEAPKVIKFTHATQDHSFVVNAVLQPEQGITHDVFNQGEDDDAGEGAGEDGEEGEAAEVKERDIIDSFKHIHVAEVVREKRIHF